MKKAGGHMTNTFNFIKTKLIVPLPRKNYVRRKKLESELNNISDYKVAVVKGAAASGKSTLISSFIKDKNLKNVKWISLDEGNNNLHSFWYYFVESIIEYFKDEGQDLLNNLNGMVKSDEIFNIITYIINKMPQDDIYIVFDDYHYINEKFLNSTVEYLIKYSPPNVHYIFLTRNDLPIYLGELRVRGEILEIGEDDLKFSRDECSDFVKNTLNINLDENSIGRLFDVSEGWIGGIQLSALAFRGKSYVGDKNVNTLNKYVIEYLTEEILKQLDKGERDFLIKTSVLDYFNSELCNYVLEIEDSEDIIDSLVNKNLFVITVNENEHVYRYHHLFREFLNINFDKMSDDDKINIHLRAYSYFKGMGNTNEGIKHLLQIKYYEKAVEEMEQNKPDTETWSYLKMIPLRYIENNYNLLIQRMFYHFSNLQMDECKKIIKFIDNFHDEKHKVVSKLFKLYVCDYRKYSMDDFDVKVIEDLKLNDITKAIVYIGMEPILTEYGRYEDVIKNIAFVESIVKSYDLPPYIRIFSEANIASIYEEMGQYEKTVETYEKIKKIIGKSEFLKSYKFIYYLGVAGILMKRYEIAKAEEYLKIAKESFSLKFSSIYIGIDWNIIELKYLEGKFKEGRELEAEISEKFKNSRLAAAAEYSIYSCALKNSIPMNCYTLDEVREFKNIFENNYDRYMETNMQNTIVYCRVLYILGDMDKSIEILDRVLERCRKYSIKTYLIEGLIVKTLILHEKFKDKKIEMFNLLSEAIYYASGSGYLRPFIIEGSRLAKIISEFVDYKGTELTLKEKNFIKRLHDAAEPHEHKKSNILSDREMEVLKVLSEGASNKEICEKLNISLATVKTHIINIYSKLEVSNRVQAYQKAKEMKLI